MKKIPFLTLFLAYMFGLFFLGCVLQIVIFKDQGYDFIIWIGIIAIIVISFIVAKLTRWLRR